MVTGFGAGLPKADARYATGGSSNYKGMIDWFEWNTTTGVNIPNNTTRTNTRIVGGQTLATTCTLSSLSGTINSYRPGQWQGDALDDLYNIDGTGTNNKLINGIGNTSDGAQVSFNLACAATLNGVSVELPGLVVADAEQSASSAEWIETAPLPVDSAPNAKWRIIDRFRNDGCNVQTRATVNRSGITNANTLRLASASSNNCGSGPMAVAFMEGATQAKITMKGGGKSAVALGVLFSTDFGDAPLSYGEAGAGFSGLWSEGTPLNLGTTGLFGSSAFTDVSASSFVLASPGQPLTRLGARVDSEGSYQASADALGDDKNGPLENGSIPNDEDGIVPGEIVATPGLPYTLAPVSCTGPGTVAGWIDWNRNGVFDAGERSASATCTGTTTVNLTWASVPTDAVLSNGIKTFMRLRIAATAADVANPTGFAANGEVEDYAVTVTIPNLQMTKTSTATADSRPGDRITYTVTAKNVGKTAFTAAFPAIFSDDLSGVLDDGVYQNDAAAVPAGTLSYAQPKLTWRANTLAVNASVTMTYSVILGSTGDGVVRNVAYAGPAAATTPSCNPGSSIGDGTVNGAACAQTVNNLPRLTINKTASSTSLPAVGATLEYTVVVTNPGPGSFTSAAPATVTDDLSQVLDDGTVAVPTATSGTASITGTAMNWTGALAAGATVTIKYVTTYRGTGDKELRNTACVPAALSVPGSQPCSSTTTPAAAVTPSKTSSPTSGTTVDPNSLVSFTLSFNNTGKVAGTVNSIDNLTAVLDDANFNAGSITASSGTTAAYDATNKRINITGSVAAGATSTVTYTVRVKSSGFGNGSLDNYLLQAGETPPTSCLPTSTICTTHPVTAQWSLGKTASPASGAYVSPGDTISYTVTASNQGGAVPNAVITDDLTNVMPGATFVAGSASFVIGTGTPVAVADPSAASPNKLVTQAFVLPVNSTAVLSYKVTVKTDAWSKLLTNSVTGSAGAQTATCPTVCTTSHRVSAKVLIDKIGESSNNTWVPMDGSTWTLNTDNAGSIGGPLASPTVVKISLGHFSIEALKPGSYWLTETAAPKGFNLLATPVQFTVNDAGLVTVGSGNGNGVVTASVVSTGADTGRGLMTVKDVPALQIPEAGGPGTLPFTFAGGALLLLAAVLLLRNRFTRQSA